MNKLIKFVSWFEIVSGILAVCLSTYIAYLSHFTFPTLYGAIPLGTVGAISVLAGTLLLKSKKIGWYLSLILQFIQLPVFALGTAFWRLGLGIFATVTHDIPKITSALVGHFGIGMEFYFGGVFQVQFGQELDEQYFGLNVTALVLLYLLYFYRARIE